MVTAEQQSFTVVQISDIHLGLEPGPLREGLPDSDAQLEAVLLDVRRRHRSADLVLVTGDLADDPKAPDYQRMIDHLSGLTSPIVALAGNHDDHGAARETFLRSGHGFDGEQVLGDWLVVGLNSCWPGHIEGLVEPGELQRLEESIARHPGHWVLVAVHHPVVLIGSRWLDELTLTNGDQLLATMARHPNVRACVFGHIHQAYDEMHGPIRLLACPSTLMQFLPASVDYTLDPVESGYRVLQLHPDGSLETEVRRVPGTLVRGLRG